MDNHDVRMIAAGVARRVSFEVFPRPVPINQFPRLVDIVEEQLRIELVRTGTKIMEVP